MSRKNRKNLLVLALLVIALLVWVILAEAGVDWRGLRQSMETMPRGTLLVLVAVLPVLGFSISLVYLVVGAVFGGWPGMAVVGAITAVHLLGSHWIGRSFLRAPVQRFLHRRKHRLPDLPAGEEWAVTLMTALVPGLPYFVRNYLLAVSDIPLRIYFWICWPVYFIRSSVVIFMGDFSGDITLRRVLLLGTVLLVKVAICAWLIYHLRARYQAAHGSPATHGSGGHGFPPAESKDPRSKRRAG